MKTLRKRLTCINRNTEQKNVTSMELIIDRYVNKMSKNGWHYIANEDSSGNAFFYWEHYLTLYKPDCEKDYDFIAKEQAYQIVNRRRPAHVTEDGVWVMNALKKLGWINKSYVKSNQKCSKFFVACGYHGGYTTSHLVKIFKE